MVSLKIRCLDGLTLTKITMNTLSILADIVFSLKMWCHYLKIVYIDVFNKHKILEYVLSLKDHIFELGR